MTISKLGHMSFVLVSVYLLALLVSVSSPYLVFADCSTVDSLGNVVPCANPSTGSGSTVGGDAQGSTNTTNPTGSTNSTSAQGSTYGTPTQSSAQIQNPLNGINSVSDFIKKLLQAVIVIGVPIAALFIILAGFKFITAQGNSEQLATARTNFIHVVIGVGIFIGAWALSELIVATLRSAGIPV